MPYSLYSRRGIRIWIECTCRCDMTAAGAGAHYKLRRRVPFCVASLVLRTNPSVGNAETKSNVGKCHTYTELPFVAVVYCRMRPTACSWLTEDAQFEKWVVMYRSPFPAPRPLALVPALSLSRPPENSMHSCSPPPHTYAAVIGVL